MSNTSLTTTEAILVNVSGLVQQSPLPSLTSTTEQLSYTVTNVSIHLWDTLDFSQILHQPECPAWAPLNHIYFQLANLLLLLSCLAPGDLAGLLYLRSTLLLAFSLYCAWGWTVTCALDTAVWNLLLLTINACWVCGVAWRVRPVRLEKDMERVYTKLFQPLKVSRRQFKSLLSGTKERRRLAAKEFIIEEKVSRVNSLSLVLSGRLLVSQSGKALHLVTEHQFLDSPEWFGVTTDEYFQVSVTAMEECDILVWHRDKLKFHIMADSFLQAVFDHVLGRDVVKKLMQVHNRTEEDVASSKDTNIDSNSEHDYDDGASLVVKQVGLEQGLVASLLGLELRSWGLGNIQETEDETLV